MYSILSQIEEFKIFEWTSYWILLDIYWVSFSFFPLNFPISQFSILDVLLEFVCIPKYTLHILAVIAIYSYDYYHCHFDYSFLFLSIPFYPFLFTMSDFESLPPAVRRKVRVYSFPYPITPSLSHRTLGLLISLPNSFPPGGSS
jgi:hypothetical protein